MTKKKKPKMLKLKSNQKIKCIYIYRDINKNKKDSWGIELYGHTYILIVGQVHLFRFQSIKNLCTVIARSNRF